MKKGFDVWELKETTRNENNCCISKKPHTTSLTQQSQQPQHSNNHTKKGRSEKGSFSNLSQLLKGVPRFRINLGFIGFR